MTNAVGLHQIGDGETFRAGTRIAHHVEVHFCRANNALMVSVTFSPVLTGTVLLSTTIL